MELDIYIKGSSRTTGFGVAFSKVLGSFFFGVEYWIEIGSGQIASGHWIFCEKSSSFTVI